MAGIWVVSLQTVTLFPCVSLPRARPGAGAWQEQPALALYVLHGTQWAAVLIEQIKLASNWLIGEGFCKAARSKLSRNERSAHL